MDEDEYAFEIIDESGQTLTVALNVNGNIDLIDEDGTTLELLVRED